MVESDTGWTVRYSNSVSCKNFSFSFSKKSKPALGPNQPPILLVRGFLFLGVKRPGLESDHSPL